MFLMMFTNLLGRPYYLKSFQRVILSKLSKAFPKSTKFMYRGLCHSTHCSTMILSVAMWSVQDLSFLNPACSFLSCLSRAPWILSSMIRHRTLLGMDNSIIPLQFLHSLWLPFLGSLTSSPVFHSDRISSVSQILFNSPYRSSVVAETSAFRMSGGMLSNPGAFPSLSFLIALLISSDIL